MGYFYSDMRRLSKNYAWYAGIIGVALSLFFSLEGRGFENDCVIFTYVFATDLSGSLLAYVFCAFPFATVFIEDLENRYLYYAVARGKLNSYVLSKSAAVYLSSVVTMAAGTLLFLAYCRMQIPWVAWEATDLGAMQAGCYGSLIQAGHYLGYCVLHSLHMGMLSGILSVAAAFFSTFISNRVLVLALPVLLYQISITSGSGVVWMFDACNKNFEKDWQNLLFVFLLSLAAAALLSMGICKKLKQRL